MTGMFWLAVREGILGPPHYEILIYRHIENILGECGKESKKENTFF